ncbi:MAG: hypothetical protein KTR20_07245 [Cellvibrionaceae bacterium]|nr:hypothetical protein [Cellvibrionaceae bacterium]
MFENHNKLTKASYWLLAISSVIGFIISMSTLPQLASPGSWPVSIMGVVLTLVFLLNAYFAYLIYKRSLKAIKFCMWLYGLQILGFESENVSFSLAFGLQVFLSINSGSGILTINFAATVVFIILLLAYRSVKNANKDLCHQ